MTAMHNETETCDEHHDRLWEEAGIYAAELEGTNSPNYESLQERKYDELCEQYERLHSLKSIATS